MKIHITLFILVLSYVLVSSCQSERYRTDRKNQMTKKQQAKNNFASNQAIELTQENIENRDVNKKAARRRTELMQEQLNELNEKDSKVKKNKKHSGNFRFY